MDQEAEANLKKQLRSALEGLFAVRGLRPVDVRDGVLMIAAWIEDLSDLTTLDAIEAIRRFRRESTDYPTPAAVRRYAPGVAGLSAEERSALAWGLFQSALSCWGYRRAMDFEDSAIHVAARALGGVARLGDLSRSDIGFREKLFRSAYEAAARTGVGDHSALGGGGPTVLIPAAAIGQTEALRVLCHVRANGLNPSIPMEVSGGKIEEGSVDSDSNGRRRLSGSDSGSGQTSGG
jgi:hypothetical protein